MTRPAAADFPELERVFSGYLHEDFAAEYGEPAAALRAYFDDASPAEWRQFQHEGMRLIALGERGRFDDVRTIIHELGSRWTPASTESLTTVLKTAMSLTKIDARPLPAGSLLDVLLDSWDRNNTILVNLLRALPEGGLEAKPTDGGKTVAQMFMHIHYVRLIFVRDDAPDFAQPLHEGEWRAERDRERITAMLNASAKTVREAVAGQLRAGRMMAQHYDHPILMLQHMIWHEGYHHGQIKLALKAAGQPFDDEDIGAVTWDVWMDKTR